MSNRKNIYQDYYKYYKPRVMPGGQANNSLRLPSHKHHLRKVFIVAVVLLVLVASLAYSFTDNGKTVTKKYISKILSVTKTIRPAPSPSQNAKLMTMSNTINSIINQNSDIDTSVSLVDLSNNQAENYGDSEAFAAASTTKVITAADFLKQVELGRQSLSETINGNTAEYEIQQMIVVSDDNAWAALDDVLGYPQLQSYANNIGLNSFQSVPNTVTSDDMALFLEKLYEGQLLNSSNTKLLLSYMKQSDYRGYIVPAIPTGYTVYHKIGLYEDNVNDEAIITNGNKAFVIVIFTNGNGVYNWPARATMMQQITKAALAAYF